MIALEKYKAVDIIIFYFILMRLVFTLVRDVAA